MTCFSIQKFPVFALACLFLFAAAPARAQADANDGPPPGAERIDRPIVVELFTAADCSACILADRMLYDAAQEDNVIALSCKIGEGKFAAEGEGSVEEAGPMDPCVFRQWTYKTDQQQREVSITLPQFIINGDRSISGGALDSFYRTINNYHYAYLNDVFDVVMSWKDKDTVRIYLPDNPEQSRKPLKGSVWILRYKDMAVQKVSSGDNAGRVLRFSNIIEDSTHIGKWHGIARTLDIDVPVPKGGKERGGYVVLVQELMGSPVLAAGKLADYPLPGDTKRDKPSQ